MALHFFEFNGKIGNVVFYTRNGQHLVRKAPRKGKRTAAMKARSRNFGIAAGTAKSVRTMLVYFIPQPTTNLMQSRLTGAISRWLGSRVKKDILPENNIESLAAFQFNDQCRFSKRWKAGLELVESAKGVLQLKLPALTPLAAISAPDSTVSVTLQVRVVAVDLATGIEGSNFSENIEIPYNNKAIASRLLDMPLKMKKGSLVVSSCALLFHVKEKGKIVVSKDPLYLPAAVIEARYC